MVTPLSAPSVSTIRPSRSGVLPWLKMMTASAPAASAFNAFTAKVHAKAGGGGPPRWIRAMSAGPDQSPTKSVNSQPLVVAAGSARLRSTGITLPVTSPFPLPVNVPVSYSASTGVSCRSRAGKTKVELDRVERHLVPGGPELTGDVVDAALVPVHAGGARAGVARSSVLSAIAWNAAWCSRTPASVMHSSPLR